MRSAAIGVSGASPSLPAEEDPRESGVLPFFALLVCGGTPEVGESEISEAEVSATSIVN